MPSFLMFNSSIKDCSTPTETGYDFTGTTATTYLGTSNVACATGYDGTASPAQIQCEANGSWTTVTGCTITGKCFILYAFLENKHMNYAIDLGMRHPVCPSVLLLFLSPFA